MSVTDLGLDTKECNGSSGVLLTEGCNPNLRTFLLSYQSSVLLVVVCRFVHPQQPLEP